MVDLLGCMGGMVPLATQPPDMTGDIVLAAAQVWLGAAALGLAIGGGLRRLRAICTWLGLVTIALTVATGYGLPLLSGIAIGLVGLGIIVRPSRATRAVFVALMVAGMAESVLRGTTMLVRPELFFLAGLAEIAGQPRFLTSRIWRRRSAMRASVPLSVGS